jgi:hypothetical protein
MGTAKYELVLDGTTIYKIMFILKSGARQGVVLSPVLSTVCVNDIIHKLEK